MQVGNGGRQSRGQNGAIRKDNGANGALMELMEENV